MNRRHKRAAALAALIPVGLAVAAAVWIWTDLHRPWRGWDASVVVVDLPRGLGAEGVLARLARAGVIRRPAVARAWLVLRGGGSELRAGEYRFDRPATPLEVLDRLRRGDVVLHPVTVPEGLALNETAARVAEAGFGPAERLLEAFRNPAPVRDLDPEAEDLEGYLFPDTYHFPKGQDPAGIARAMVRRFQEAAGESYAARAAHVGLTVRQAVTLASLIEKETSVPEERARISRVFHNRLARGMPLQCDPTVVYALRRAGRNVRRLSRRDLRFDSPFNTYRHPGLPPGPICSPGLASLQAAVEPTEGDDLYFVASPGGGHAFSSSLRAHRRAVRAWKRYERSSE